MSRPLRHYTIPWGAQFGAPRAGGRRKHEGCDYHAPIGTPIYGTGSGGKVVKISYNGSRTLGLGHSLRIVYTGGRETLDGHMRARTPLHLGSTVNTNTIVGYVGLTGNAVIASPPGSHDHHQVWVNGKLVDPESYYRTQPAGGGTRINERENEMHAIREPGGGIALIGETTYQGLTLAQWNAESKVWGSYTQLSKAEYTLEIANTQVRRAYLLAGISGTSASSVDVDQIVAKVSANIEADLTKLSDDIAAINTNIGAPTADEIADAVRDKIIKD